MPAFSWSLGPSGRPVRRPPAAPPAAGQATLAVLAFHLTGTERSAASPALCTLVSWGEDDATSDTTPEEAAPPVPLGTVVHVAACPWASTAVRVPRAAVVAGAAASVRPMAAHFSTLAGPGTDAYLAMVYVGRPAAGELVLVDAVDTPLGAVAAQVAKLHGARVVGAAATAHAAAAARARYGLHAAVGAADAASAAVALNGLAEPLKLCFLSGAGYLLDAALPKMAKGVRSPPVATALRRWFVAPLVPRRHGRCRRTPPTPSPTPFTPPPPRAASSHSPAPSARRPWTCTTSSRARCGSKGTTAPRTRARYRPALARPWSGGWPRAS